MAQSRNSKFDEERIKKIKRLLKNNLDKPVFLENYKQDEINQAKREIECEPKKPMNSIFTLPEQKQPLITRQKLDDDCLDCVPCKLF